MISFKQLTYALAVAETRHFRQAAEKCNVSQSALSTAIQELETQLGFQVFERDNRKVLITTMGREFLSRAEQVKVQMDDLNQMARTTQEPLSYPVSMGVIPTIGPYLLPKVLPEVRRQFPKLDLIIEEDQSEVLVSKVRQGDLDIGVLALPYDVSGLHSFHFWDENFFLICHQSDELAGLDSVTHEDLAESELLLLKDGHCLKDHALAVCKFPFKQGSRSLEGTSLYTLIQMVAGKMGSTLVPELAVDQLMLQSPDLTALPINEPGPHRQLAFICRLNYAGVNNIEKLRELFTQQLI